jgi:23S rRNA (guanosine2251-2'-O)-methyltransferase
VGECPEWQRGRTVNPLAYAFVGSSPTSPTICLVLRASLPWRSNRHAVWVPRCGGWSYERAAGLKNGRKHAFRRVGHRRAEPAHRRPRPTRGEGDDGVVLYGWHTVTAALANPARRIRRILATENAARRLADEGVALPVAPELVRPDAIAARLSPDAVHQGLLAEADPLPSPALSDLTSAGIVLVLDQITDPHNFGAILRTAAAFAVAAIVTTARHSPEATGVLAKSASGALEMVPFVIVQNLARSLAEMKEQGFLVVGLDSNAPDDLSAIELASPLALVLGAEGKGLRQGTRAVCDRLARLDLPGAIKSLNVSNAAALALYVASRATKPA